MPLSVGASSKVIMAFSENVFQEEVFASNTWLEEVGVRSFKSQLQKVREEGYALSVEEREAGTAAISVPVFDRQGSFVAALAISGPVPRMSRKRMQGFVPGLLEAAEKMGRRVKRG